MFDLIPIVSVNHTGSHSVAERFNSQLPDYNYIQGNKFKYLEYGIFKGKFPLDKTRGNIVRGIINDPILKFAISMSREGYRLVVPIRDPLLCLITSKDWYTNSEYIINGFIYWAGWILSTDPFHIPVDLDTSDLTHKGVNFKDLEVVHRTKDSKNDFRSRDLRKAYYSKDSKFLFDNIKEFKALCEREFIIRPPLEKLGYRDLLWWDYV